MLRAVIVEDEISNRETLIALLARYCEGKVNVVAQAENVLSAYKAIDLHKPQLVFLDIELSLGTGFDLLEQIEKPDFEVIFITAYDHHAIKAFRVSALDYLLKPIDVDELIEAVNKAEARIQQKTPNVKIQNFIQNQQTSTQNQKIALASREGQVFVPLNDLIRCEADDSYTLFYRSNGAKITVSRTMKYFEEVLPVEKFIRIHHSHIINLMHVKKLLKMDGGTVEMNDGSIVPISRRKKSDFLKKLAEFNS